MKHPMQPIHFDDNGVIRFKKNEIVEFLLDNGGFDMNKLALIGFTDEDREQFAQLIGYSVGGFGELSYVSDDAYYSAVSAAENYNWSAQMAKYIFRCIDNRLYACNVGDYCTGHSWYGDDGYTDDIAFATVYDEAVKKDADEIAVIDLDCYGDFERIEVKE